MLSKDSTFACLDHSSTKWRCWSLGKPHAGALPLPSIPQAWMLGSWRVGEKNWIGGQYLKWRWLHVKIQVLISLLKQPPIPHCSSGKTNREREIKQYQQQRARAGGLLPLCGSSLRYSEFPLGPLLIFTLTYRWLPQGLSVLNRVWFSHCHLENCLSFSKTDAIPRALWRDPSPETKTPFSTSSCFEASFLFPPLPPLDFLNPEYLGMCPHTLISAGATLTLKSRWRLAGLGFTSFLLKPCQEWLNGEARKWEECPPPKAVSTHDQSSL